MDVLPAAPSVCPYTLLTERSVAECSLLSGPVRAPPIAPTSAHSILKLRGGLHGFIQGLLNDMIACKYHSDAREGRA